MIEWMIMPLKRYADFEGRSRRLEYWSFALLNFIISIVILALMAATGGLGSLMNQNDVAAGPAFGVLFGGVGIILLIYSLAVIIPSIAVTVRRFHDRDMSGWWYLAFIVGSLIPFVGFIAAIALIVIMFLPGTVGPNRFGPDPKNPGNIDVFE